MTPAFSPGECGYWWFRWNSAPNLVGLSKQLVPTLMGALALRDSQSRREMRAPLCYLSTLWCLRRTGWRMFGALLLVGLMVTGAMMMTLAEIHEHLGARAWRVGTRGCRTRCMRTRLAHDAGDVCAIADRLAGSADAYDPGDAALLWWRRLRNAARVWLIATGGGYVLVTALEATLPTGEAGPALGVCA